MTRATLVGILALVCWMSFGLFISLTGAIPPFQLAAITMLIGAVSIYGFETCRGSNPKVMIGLPLKTYAFGIMGMGLYTILLYAAYKLTYPFLASTLNHLWPIFLALGLAYYDARRPSSYEMAGFLLGFIGAAIIFAQKYNADHLILSPTDIAGCIVSVIAAGVWAIYSVKARTIQYPAITSSIFFMVSACIAAILHFSFETTVWPDMTAWIFIVLLGVGRMTYTLWDHAMKYGDRELLSSLSYFVPLGSALILTLAGYFPPSGILILGGVMIIVGCLITNFKKIKAGLRKTPPASIQ